MTTQPFAFQVEGVERLEEWSGRGLLAFQQGLGKTLTALLLAKRNPDWWPVVVVCPSVVKWSWRTEAAQHFGMHAEVLEGTRVPRRAKLGNLVVLNYDILHAWADRLREMDPQLVIVDECFPGDTPILTNAGWVPIREIVEGKLPLSVASVDLSSSAIEFRPITHYFTNVRRTRMVTIHHEMDTLLCTEHHRVWTENRGYVEAGHLVEGDELCVLPQGVLLQAKRREGSKILLEDMCRQWDEKGGEGRTPVPDTLRVVRIGESDPNQETEVLLPFLLAKEDVFAGDEKNDPSDTGEHQTCAADVQTNGKGEGSRENQFQGNDRKEPVQTTRGSREDQSHERGKGVFPRLERETRRQRNADDPANGSLGAVTQTLEGMENGNHRADRAGLCGRLPVSQSLQTGHRQRSTENRGGSGWQESSHRKEESRRREKSSIPHISRVVRVEVHEPTSRQHPDRSGESHTLVYCLEVEQNHNFFAGGVLVSNCHYIKSATARRTKALRRLCAGVPHVVALSGTPLTNKPAELWTTLNLLRPDLYPSFRSFAMAHCRPKRMPWGWTFDGAKDLDHLHTALTSTLMVRKRKEEVLKNLPPKRQSLVPLDLDDRAEYDRAEKDFAGWLRDKNPNRLDRALRAESLVKVGHLKRLAGELKLPSVKRWTDDFLEASDGKLILFCTHRKVLESLAERYGNLCCVVDGSVTGRDRERAVRRFQTVEKARLFLGNVKAAGVGITLTAAADLAFAEFPWTPGDLEQASDRTHRIGQKNAVTIHHLVARGTMEEHLVELLSRKQRVVSAVLDGGREAREFDIHKELLRKLKEGEGK